MRSMLFVPGDSRPKLAKAMASGADALIIDLEDSMAFSAKQAARETTLAFLNEARSQPGRPLLLVRVNGLTTGLIDADLDAVMMGGPDGIVLPKAEGGRDAAHLGAKLAVREAENNLPDGQTRIHAIATETAKGVFALGSFAGATHRLASIAWGAEDLSADLGAETNREESGRYAAPYRLARAMTLLGAAAAEVMAVDAVYTNFRDLDGLAIECEAARRDGFVAKMAIHPAQVPVINAAFTPTPEAVARAKAIVDAFAVMPGAGVIGLEGEMLDLPHLKRAERTLSRVPKA
ncbi:MAG: HpcH/HpaI aldolase/citrate lyase family protein [Bosea sp. (in: a-proteobacteria)]